MIAGRAAWAVGFALLTGCAWKPAPHTPKSVEKEVVATSTHVAVRVKSFIAPIASAEYRPHEELDATTAKRLGFAGSWLTQNAAREFMHAADDMFSEDPRHGESTVDDYRLHSAKDLTVTCDGDRVANVEASPMRIDVGFDAGMKGTGRVLEDRLHVDSRRGIARFVMHMRGQPPEEVEAAFEVVTPRTCRSIWHRVEGTVRCKANKPMVHVRASGSAFPSHRVWVDGAEMGTLRQGPMESLWMCSPNESTLIR